MAMTTASRPSAARRRYLGVPAADAPWLLYLGFLFMQPLFDPVTSWRTWAWVAVLVVVFIPIYGWTHRVIAARPWLWRSGTPGAVLGIAAMIALTLIGSLVNSGSATFGIYAMAAAGKLSPRRNALIFIGLALAGMAVAFFLSPNQAVYRLVSFVPAALVGIIIGLSVLFDRERKEVNAKLRMAQGEAEHLAAIAERERIARDLHDLLGHTLSTITLKSELAANLVDHDPQRAQSEIRDVERLSRETLAEVRSVVRGYRTTGLAGEVANAKLALEAAGIEFDYFVDSLALKPSAEGVFALALREAVTNVVRHAAATHFRATLEADAGFVTLTVEDDGRGVPQNLRDPERPDQDAANDPRGFGLSAMGERARSLGGFVTLEPSSTASRSGALLRVGLPLAAALQPAEQSGDSARTGSPASAKRAGS